mmetsp:Transcript_4080/g.6932  ORF Transcript_4080/g.6932 Transcript_4080/m.6932 type:complete len:88 (+) Transcript_4080:155-418(+)
MKLSWQISMPLKYPQPAHTGIGCGAYSSRLLQSSVFSWHWFYIWLVLAFLVTTVVCPNHTNVSKRNDHSAEQPPEKEKQPHQRSSCT